MGLITWNRGLETGHAAIDAQHQGLLEAYNLLRTAFRQGADPEGLEAALLRLRDRTREHFRDEEALMDEAQYAGILAHRQLHQDLLTQLQDILERFQADPHALTAPVLDFLAGWLVFHIKDEDVRLVRFLMR